MCVSLIGNLAVFAMGSKLLIECLNFKSIGGKPKIILRNQALTLALLGDYNWLQFDLLYTYAVLFGSDLTSLLFL